MKEMRGQGVGKQVLKSGRTIVAERERAESESERMQARRKAHRKHTTSVFMILLMAAVVILAIYLGGKEMMQQKSVVPSEQIGNGEDNTIAAEVIDEETGNLQLSGRMKKFIATLEQDFRDLGYKVRRVILPTGKSHELYIDLEGIDPYFKVSTDRDTAVSAEDVKRVIRYLEEGDIHPQYVDVRVEGKAYYQ